MKIGKYQIGCYHAIIKKTYEGGVVLYETSFSDEADLMESVYCINQNIGKLCGTATDNPMILKTVEVIRGTEAITKELEN